jgi:predicted Rossmann fold nucleotide-binding protein DprA/Smf involved in DNA uptake
MSLLSQDTQAVLLLCTRLGQRDGSLKPLTARQYTAIEKWLNESSLRPGDLLHTGGRERLSELSSSDVPQDAIEKLLDRGAALGLMVERWTSQGLWIASRGDSAYPTRYEGYLQHAAPPVLYGVGEQALLQHGGVAVAGSRDASEEDLSFAERVGSACARQGIPVISGAAKGVDSAAMMAALNHGGSAVGVLAEGLGRAAVAGQYHDAIMDSHLTLISAYEPESPWRTFAAMERNKLIYALADTAIVVAASDGQGGTWAGAVEALKRGQIPVFVKASGELAGGNRNLLQTGAREFPEAAWNDLLLLSQSAAVVQPLFEQRIAQPDIPAPSADVSDPAPIESGSKLSGSARKLKPRRKARSSGEAALSLFPKEPEIAEDGHGKGHADS